MHAHSGRLRAAAMHACMHEKSPHMYATVDDVGSFVEWYARAATYLYYREYLSYPW